jgi:hypothetical protein
MKTSIFLASIIVVLAGVPAVAQYDKPSQRQDSQSQRSNPVGGQTDQRGSYGHRQQNDVARQQADQQGRRGGQQQSDRANTQHGQQDRFNARYGSDNNANSRNYANRGGNRYRYRGHAHDYRNSHSRTCSWRHGHRRCY